jgi:hypothetical protein
MAAERGQQFADEMYPSVEGTLSEQAEDSQMDWATQSKYPAAYLKEANHPDAGFEHRDYIQRNLHRMGFVNDDNTVTVRRVGEPRAPFANVSILPKWGESNNSTYGQDSRSNSDSSVYEWKVPIHHVVGLGHDMEGELWVLHHPSTKITKIGENKPVSESGIGSEWS